MYKEKISKIQALQKKFLSEMQKPQCESWLECDKLLKQILEAEPTLPRQFQADIRDQLPKIKNLLVLLLIYNYKVKVAQTYIYKSPYNEAYITLCREPNLQKIDQWLDQLQQQALVQQTAELILEGLGGLLHKEVKRVKVEDCKFMFRQFSRYSVRREREVGVVVNFMGRLQGISFAENSSGRKEITLIKIIVELLTSRSGHLPNASNLGLVFDTPCLGSAEERNIENYIQLNEDYLLSLSEDQLKSIFFCLTRSTISFLSLSFLLHLTIFLSRQQEFYKLRYLYQKLILSHIARRAKCCKKPNIQDAVLRIAETYVIGFYEHCQIGEVGLKCLLENVELVDNDKNLERWIALAKQISYKEGGATLKEFNRWVKQKKMKDDVKICEAVLRGNDIWKITTRSIKKHKVYEMKPSTMTGIVNKGNQCYIISIVQALFMTKLLQSLLDKAKPKNKIPVIDSLVRIFKDLKECQRQEPPTVQSLKRHGPEAFVESQHQQDAQDYLINLMDQLQKQFKIEGLQAEFKKIFQIQSDDTLQCLKCDYKKVGTQNQYVHTISHKEIFSCRYQEQIDDYSCQKCKQKQVKKTTQLKLNNRILILHINRFSVKNGSTKKELATQKIRRKIEGGYELIGMVFHIGKRIQSGHYVYYSRVSKTRWAEMNDRVVKQFDLEREDEEFELEMKEEKTPYILFYKKNDKK